MTEPRPKTADEVSARELSVKEIMDFLSSPDKESQVHFTDILFSDSIPMDVVCMSTGLALQDFIDMAPTEIEKIVDKVLKKNPFFLTAIRRLAAVAETISKATPLPDQTLSPASAPS